MEQKYLTPEAIAKRLRVNVTPVRLWITAGALDAETICEGKRNRRFIKPSIIEMLEASQQPNTTIASF